MGHKESCEDIREKLCLLNDTQSVPQELQQHLDNCPACRKEYEAQKRLYGFIRDPAPEVPKLSDKVMTRIREEKLEIKPDDMPRRLRLPLGTIAAAVAVLTVYVSVYYSKLPLAAFQQDTKTADIEMNESTPMLFSKSTDFSGTIAADTDSQIDSEESDELYDSVAESPANGVKIDSENGTTQTREAESDGLPTDFIPQFSLSVRGDAYEDNDTNEYQTENGLTQNNGVIDGLTTKDEGGDAAPYSEEIDAIGANGAGSMTNGAEQSDGNANVVEPGNAQNESKHRDEASGGGGGSSGGGGSNGLPVQNETVSESSANARFESLSEQYPDRIDRATFESVGAECYLAFVAAITDFETEYTADNLQRFSEAFGQTEA